MAWKTYPRTGFIYMTSMHAQSIRQGCLILVAYIFMTSPVNIMVLLPRGKYTCDQPLLLCYNDTVNITFKGQQSYVLLLPHEAVARILANGIATLKKICATIGWKDCDTISSIIFMPLYIILVMAGVTSDAQSFSTHYSDVIMSAMAYRITGVSVVYSTVFSDVDQRK